LNFVLPQLTATGISYTPNAYAIDAPWDDPVLKSIHTMWDLAQFHTARRPWIVGSLPAGELHGLPSVVDMPVKFPGNEYRFPKELHALYAVLRPLLDIEKSINERVEEYYAYVTLDTRSVRCGTTQRMPRPHVDGFQGTRINPKQPIEHHYVFYDSIPTEFHWQSFSLDNFDHSRDVWDALSAQVMPEKTIFFPPNAVAFIDAYTVHSAVPAACDQSRVFVRLSYSVRQLDRLGNTHNPMFDYDWKMVERPWPYSEAGISME
jgi:hypothetical protein